MTDRLSMAGGASTRSRCLWRGFNSLPIRHDGLHLGGESPDYVMAWVEVPSLDVRRSKQHYEPLPGLAEGIA